MELALVRAALEAVAQAATFARERGVVELRHGDVDEPARRGLYTDSQQQGASEVSVRPVESKRA